MELRTRCLAEDGPGYANRFFRILFGVRLLCDFAD